MTEGLKGIDELGQLTEAQFKYLLERNRAKGKEGMNDLRTLLFTECPDCGGTGSLGRVLKRGMAYRAGSVGRIAACERCGGTMDSIGRGVVLRDDIDEQELLEALRAHEAKGI